jgi:membrane protein DedA with SNARE-associated domain
MSDFLFDAPTLAVSVGIVTLSFISEDAAAVSSALLVLGGPVAWPVGFVSCFLGIWAGDLGIYSAARWGGRPLLRSRVVASRISLAVVDRLEQNFARRAEATLFVSRFLPGTRVVTYVAAGLFATPLLSFALVTGCAVFLWVATIFGLTKLLGAAAFSWFSTTQSPVAAIVFVAFCAAGGAIALLRKPVVARGADPGQLQVPAPKVSRRHHRRVQLPPFLRRWTHWEFWPSWLFYLPVAAYYAWLGLRYRSFTLPSAANPAIPTGGLVGESKSAIIDLLHRAHPHHVADGYLIGGSTTADRLKSFHRILRQHDLTLPFILKPDYGQRGNGVRLIRSMAAARDYLERVSAPVLVQRYASGPCEAGIFYYRFPDESRGRIFSITEKIFPEIRGDGRRTIEQLILADPRASLIARKYLTRFAARRTEVLAAGERLKLVESGNHAQGCIFRDGAHLWTRELEEAIDRISRLQGFHIGRYDIRYVHDEDLRRGENFQIVELNGAASEATNIYDAHNSLGQAYRTLFTQWRLVFAIGDINRRRAAASVSLRELWREWRKYSRAALSYPLAD